MKYIKDNLISIIVIVLLLILLLQKCNDRVVDSGIKIVRDTTWIHHDSTINSKPLLIKTEPYAVPIDRWNTEYIADTNYTKLVLQYQELVKELLTTNYYRDSLHIDSLGFVIVKDTVRKNMLVGSSFSYNLKYPIIKETITLPARKRRDLYVGIGVAGEKQDLINKLHIGLMYKNKQDLMFGPSLYLEQNGVIHYGAQMYWNLTKKK